MNRFWITIAIKGYIYVQKRLILKQNDEISQTIEPGHAQCH